MNPLGEAGGEARPCPQGSCNLSGEVRQNPRKPSCTVGTKTFIRVGQGARTDGDSFISAALGWEAGDKVESGTPRFECWFCFF